jgi:manganese/iron transport system permease protein
MMAISAAIAVFSGIAGLYASYFFDVASGAAIVLSCTACFGIASIVRVMRQTRGLRRLRRPVRPPNR